LQQDFGWALKQSHAGDHSLHATDSSVDEFDFEEFMHIDHGSHFLALKKGTPLVEEYERVEKLSSTFILDLLTCRWARDEAMGSHEGKDHHHLARTRKWIQAKVFVQVQQSKYPSHIHYCNLCFISPLLITPDSSHWTERVQHSS
jgi:hypothetical protein